MNKVHTTEPAKKFVFYKESIGVMCKYLLALNIPVAIKKI